MSIQKTKAFVLKTQDYRDTSLMATFATQDFGKIKGIVRGIRDGRGRFGSTLEPFSLNEIVFYKRRRGDLHQITQVELIDLFHELRSDLEALGHCSYMSELLDQLTEEEDRPKGPFDILWDALQFMRGGASCKRTVRIFEMKLLNMLGLLPEVLKCVECGLGFRQSESIFFSPQSGGILCQSCRGEDPVALPVSKGTLLFMQKASQLPFSELERFKVSHAVGVDLERAMKQFLEFHLSFRLKSVEFLEKMGQP